MRVKDFVRSRDWERYHNPKNLAESICIEAAELLEIFQWVPDEKALTFRNDSTKLQRVTEELADILIYCLSMANAMEIEVSSIIIEKLAVDSMKYPVEEYKGKADLE
jgi:NTP pyrophosphatase (non-canonical NTP hydrolase)